MSAVRGQVQRSRQETLLCSAVRQQHRGMLGPWLHCMFSLAGPRGWLDSDELSCAEELGVAGRSGMPPAEMGGRAWLSVGALAGGEFGRSWGIGHKAIWRKLDGANMFLELIDVSQA